MRLLSRAIILLYIAFSFYSCDIINPEEAIPAYLQIDTISFISTNPSHGTSNQKITEAWVTVNDVFLGVYDLPARVPVLESGRVAVEVNAGIKDNGIGRLPEIYPFFEPYKVDVELIPAETIQLNPTTSYKEDLNFAFVEEFEVGGNLFTDDLDGNDTTSLVSSSIDVFEGNRSGLIRLTESHPVAELATDFSNKFEDLQARGVEVYLELNYKTDVEVAFGIIGHEESVFSPTEKIYEPVLFPRASWNKVYLNLSETVFVVQGEAYQIAILTALAPGQTAGNVYLDNIKLIHF
ncbi:MAG: hypothetical protein AAF849_11830 [Bacteroidota bacterium]